MSKSSLDICIYMAIILITIVILLIVLIRKHLIGKSKKTSQQQDSIAQLPPDNTSVVPPLSKAPKAIKITGFILLVIFSLIIIGFLLAITDRQPGAPIAMGFALLFFPILLIAGAIAFVIFLVTLITAAKIRVPDSDQKQEQAQETTQTQEQVQEQTQQQSQGQEQ